MKTKKRWLRKPSFLLQAAAKPFVKSAARTNFQNYNLVSFLVDGVSRTIFSSPVFPESLEWAVKPLALIRTSGDSRKDIIQDKIMRLGREAAEIFSDGGVKAELPQHTIAAQGPAGVDQKKEVSFACGGGEFL